MNINHLIEYISLKTPFLFINKKSHSTLSGFIYTTAIFIDVQE